MHRPVYVTVLLLRFCAPCSWSPFAETINAPEGENATLVCNIHDFDHMSWYRQSGAELTLLMSASRGRLRVPIIVNYNQDPARFVLSTENMSLSITAVGRADVGLYYCGRNDGVASVHFGKAIHLTLTGAVDGVVEDLPLCWRLLLSSAALFTLAVLVCLSMVGCKQGFGFCLSEKDDSGLKVMDLQYATLRLPQRTQGDERAPAPAPAHACTSVTYDTVAKNFTASPRV